MSSPAIPRVSQPQIQSSFGAQQLQNFRKIATRIDHLVMAIINEIAAFGSQIFSKTFSAEYKAKAKYHWEQFSPSQTPPPPLPSEKKIEYEVIHTGVNTPQNLTWKTGSNDLETLRATYGDSVINGYLNMGERTQFEPISNDINIQNLSRGCCLGMSIDWVRLCLKKVQEGMTVEAAIKEVAPIFEKGATPEAALTQLFFNALGHRKQTTLSTETDSDPVAAMKKLYREYGYSDAKIDSLTWDINDIHEIERVYRSKLSSQKTVPVASGKISAKRAYIDRQETIDRIELVAKQAGLFVKSGEKQEKSTSKIKDMFLIHQKDQPVDPQFSNFLDQLPVGFYLIVLQRPKDAGHAITLVKTENKYFIYDPNFGTSAVPNEKVPEILWGTTCNFYSSEPVEENYVFQKNQPVLVKKPVAGGTRKGQKQKLMTDVYFFPQETTLTYIKPAVRFSFCPVQLTPSKSAKT